MRQTVWVNTPLLFFILHCGIVQSSASPLMGKKVKPADPNEFPFIVSIGLFTPSVRSERYKNHFCGGSLLTQKHVLTAAHCISDLKPTDVTVTIGSIDLNEGKLYTVESWITYEEWAKKNNVLPEFSSNDIAVMTLSKEVTDIVPVVRSILTDAKIFGKKVVTAGWGFFANNTRPQFLHKASLKVLTTKECKLKVLKLFGTDDLMPPNHFCTVARPPVILGCGDSGGPLLLKSTREIVGVNQGVCEVDKAPAHPYATSEHVKVNYYKEFIDDVSKQ